MEKKEIEGTIKQKERNQDTMVLKVWVLKLRNGFQTKFRSRVLPGQHGIEMKQSV